jgi:hypothetical protein
MFRNPESRCPQLLAESCLLSVLLLLAANSDSLLSLRRLHLIDHRFSPMAESVELPFWSPARLPAVTHFRLSLRLQNELLCSSLVSALL